MFCDCSGNDVDVDGDKYDPISFEKLIDGKTVVNSKSNAKVCFNDYGEDAGLRRVLRERMADPITRVRSTENDIVACSYAFPPQTNPVPALPTLDFYERTNSLLFGYQPRAETYDTIALLRLLVSDDLPWSSYYRRIYYVFLDVPFRNTKVDELLAAFHAMQRVMREISPSVSEVYREMADYNNGLDNTVSRDGWNAFITPYGRFGGVPRRSYRGESESAWMQGDIIEFKILLYELGAFIHSSFPRIAQQKKKNPGKKSVSGNKSKKSGKKSKSGKVRKRKSKLRQSKKSKSRKK